MSEIKHGRGPNKRHKYIKIINGKYIYPEDLIKKGKKVASTVKDELNNAKVDSKKMIKRGRAIYDNNFTESGKKRVAKQIGTVDKVGREITNHVRRSTNTPYNTQQIYKKIPKNKKQLRRLNKAKKLGAAGSIIKRADYERKIRQKNGGYAVPKSSLEKRAENISKINQRNGKISKRSKNKYGNDAAGKIANAASSARRNTARSNNYGYDRRKMNTANRAAEKAFNSMKMPKIRKVKKSKLSEFKKKLKKVRR